MKKVKPSTLRTRLRLLVGCGNMERYPIYQIAGDDGPYFCGTGWYWETHGGVRIHYPSAYSKKGWSNMRYVESTHRIEVGVDWLKSCGICPAIIDM